MSADDRRMLNCGSDGVERPLVRRCDQRWGELDETGEERVRYCRRCDRLVHKVANVVEARVRARQGECLAVPAEVLARVEARRQEAFPEGSITIGYFDEGALIDRLLDEP